MLHSETPGGASIQHCNNSLLNTQTQSKRERDEIEVKYSRKEQLQELYFHSTRWEINSSSICCRDMSAQQINKINQPDVIISSLSNSNVRNKKERVTSIKLDCTVCDALVLFRLTR